MFELIYTHALFIKKYIYIYIHMHQPCLLFPASSCISLAALIFYLLLMHKLSLDICRFYRSAQLGQELRHQLLKIQQQYPNYIREVRGRGLFNAVELNSKSLFPISAYDFCLQLKERGILAKPTHDTIIRLTPPLSVR